MFEAGASGELPVMPTWDEIAEKVQALAMERGHYEGYPLPDDECELVVHPKFPMQGMNGYRCKDDSDDDAEHLLAGLTAEQRDRVRGLWDRFCNAEVANVWFSERRQQCVMVMRGPDGKSFAQTSALGPGRRANMMMCTIGVSRQWDFEAEMTALEKLREFIPKHLFEYYVMTGTFLERSPRSNILYVFRRCRPTLAIGNRQKVLCALCLHPIGYYSGSFGGAMVPTDDVICHLLLMRGDERRYWSQCNQHNPWMPEAGL